MRNAIVMLLLLVSLKGAAQEAGEWRPEDNYQPDDNHALPLKAAKDWVQRNMEMSNVYFSYYISSSSEGYIVTVTYVHLLPNGEETVAAGGHDTLMIGKNGKVVKHVPGA